MPSSFEFHTIDSLLKAFALSITSEVANREIEMALDLNGDTFWQPTSSGNQDFVLDLGSGGDIITNLGDRDFSSAANWANNTLATFNKTSDLTITSSASGQFCTLAAAGFDTVFKEGSSYRIIYDYVERGAGFEFRTQNESIGTLVSGTAQTIDWTPGFGGQNELRVQSLTSSADGDIDNVHIIKLDDRLTINNVAVVFHNYLTDHRGTTAPRLNVLVSHDNSVFTSWNTGTIDAWGWTVGDQILLGTNIADAQYRYIKFSWISMETTIEVSHYLVTRKSTISQGNQYPESDSTEYAVRVQNFPGGLTLKRQLNSLPTSMKIRQWLFTSLADKNVLESIYSRSHGAGLPLLMIEGSNAPDLVRIADPEFIAGQFKHHQFSPTVVFNSVPYPDPVKGF